MLPTREKHQVDKNRPETWWTEKLRRRYPVDPEIDRILTRKMRNRVGPSYKPVSLNRLVEGVQALLLSEVTGPAEVRNPRWLAGGASKLQMAFDLDWIQPGTGKTRTSMVVRMEPAASVVETSRLQEFQLVQAVGSVLPAPPCFWVDSEAEYFPYPAMIYGFAEGVTRPTGKTSNVSGFGVGFPADTRAALGKQFVEHLAALHTWDWENAGMSSFIPPSSGKHAVELVLNKWSRIWEEDAFEDIPLMHYAESWLRSNIPPLDKPSMLHGDYRTGNFLYTEHDNRITAWLDWELGHPGDPHEDLALVSLAALGTVAEDGKTFLVSGLLPEDAFYEAYEAASGIKVDKRTITYYRAFNAWRSVVSCVATGFRVAHNGKTHQDIVLSWLMCLGYALLEDLRVILEEDT